MEKRKSLSITLADNKKYLFSERNKEDVDFDNIHARIRAKNLKLIEESITDKDQQLSMMLAEMRHVYTPQEIAVAINSDKSELLKLCFDSFKVKNDYVTFEEFKKLLPAERIRHVLEVIDELENEGKKKENQPEGKD